MKTATCKNHRSTRAIIAVFASLLVLATASARQDVLARPAETGTSTLASVPDQAQSKQGGQTQPDIAIGSGFSYQGQLKDGGNPANGQYDFTFKLYDASGGGTQVGSTLTTLNQAVSAGIFTVQLDFGATAYQGQGSWLEIAVRVAGGGSYTTLAPRQAVTAIPYASSLVPGATIIGTTNGLIRAINTASGSGLWGDGADGYGVQGTSTSHVGVKGSGLTSGVWGLSTSASGYGVEGTNNSNWGVKGSGTSGVWGQGTSGFGMQGTSTSNWGIKGAGTSGVWGEAGASNGTGVSGTSPAGNGVQGTTGGGGTVAGVRGTSTGSQGSGVWGTANNGTSAYGVWGDSDNGWGVYGQSDSNWGIKGRGSSGVWGEAGASNGTGVSGSATGGIGVRGSATTGWAGYFDGNIVVTGNCTGCAGPNMMDHPLDPENQYLAHTAVQSAEMKNVYDGNVTTDAKGEAVVALPDWFEALNSDFRYQLTILGEQFAQARVSSEIKDNRFTIKTDKPNIKVSWQVTGIRKDPYAKAHPIQVEVEKSADEKGKYLHPTEYGQPESQGVNYSERQEMQPVDTNHKNLPERSLDDRR